MREKNADSRVALPGRARSTAVERAASLHDCPWKTYRTIVEQAVQATGILQDGRLVYVNRAFSRLTGYSRREAVAFSLSELLRIFHPGDRKALALWYRQRVQGRRKGAHQYFVRIFRKDGQLRWIAMSSRAIEYNGRRALLLAAWDVTARREAEAAFQLSEKQRGLIVDNMPLVAAVVAADGRLEMANRQAARALGYRFPSQIEGKTMWDLFPKAVADRHVRYIRRVIRTQKQLEDEAASMVRGEERWYRTRVVPFGSASSGKGMALVIPEEITRERHEKQIMSIQKELATKLSIAEDLRAAFDFVLQAALSLPGFDCGGVYLVKRETGALELICHRGLSRRFVQAVSYYPKGTRRARRVFQGRSVIRNYDRTRKNPLYRLEKLTAVISIPVRCGREVVGALNVASRSVLRIPPHIVRALEAIASQIALVFPRLQMATELRESEENLRTLFNTAKDMVVVLSPSGTIIEANRAFLEVVGLPRRKIIGKRIMQLIPRKERAGVPALLRKTTVTGSAEHTASFEIGNGQTISVECRLGRGFWDGRPALFAFCRDITERLKLERALRESEGKWRSLLNAITDIAVLADSDLKVLAANAGWAKSLGVNLSEAIGRNVFTFFPPDAARLRKKYGAYVFRTGRSVTFVDRCDGRWFEQQFYPVFSGDGKKVTAVAVFARDITERRRMEEEIARICDFERARIGHDLHDSLMQHLVGTAMHVAALKDRLAEKCGELVPAAIRVGELLEQSIVRARRVVCGLSPIATSEGGLAAALQALCWDARQMFGVVGRVRCRNARAIRSRMVASHLFHIVQEAVGNALRHGKASRIDIVLNVGKRCGRLTIADNGTGMPEKENQQGMGLRIMRYRAELIAGELKVRSRPRGGTLITCSFDPRLEDLHVVPIGTRRTEGAR